MRVTFNSLHDDSLMHLQRQAATQARVQNQIASGQKISRADEDPFAAQRILTMQAGSEQAQQYFRNAGHTLDISSASFSAVDEIRKVSDRVGEIASASGSGVTSSESYAAYAKELDELLEHAVAATSRIFDGQYLLGGTKTDAPPFTVTRDAQGQVTSVAYVGAAQGASFAVSENASISPFTDGAANVQLGGFINTLVALRDAMQSGDAAAVSAQRPALQSGENGVLTTLGRLGAQQRRLELSQDANSASFNELATRISAANDIDLSQAVIELTKSQTAYQASIQSTAKILSQSLLDYL